MMEQSNHTNNPLNNKQSEGKPTKWESQRSRVFASLYKSPKTMLMASHETGVERANICRIVAQFRRANKIKILYKGLCKITKHRAGYYTTDKALFNPSKTVKQ
jgi:hypothetical protein